MSEQDLDTVFIVFVCPACGQEIEAPATMEKMAIECPTCVAPIRVPARTIQPTQKALSEAQRQAMKSRTIRIELDGDF